MDLTNEAAAGGSEATAIAIAPAPAGEKPIGAREAARGLAGWRQQRAKPGTAATDEPKPAEATGEAPTKVEGGPAAPESTDAAADKEAADAQQGPTIDAEGDASPPAIEAPTSWSKPDQEAFATLPREWQQRIAARERSREAELTRLQQQAAEQGKTLDADRAGLAEARTRYESALPHLLDAMLGQQASAFADIKTMAHLERLAREDQPRYLQWDLHTKKVAAIAGELAQAQARQDAERVQKFEAFAKRHDELFREKVPEMADPAEVAKLQTAAVALLHEHGFDDAELAASWQGRKDFSLRDHRLQLVIRDAMRWRDAQHKAKAAAAKPLPPVQRPGVSQPRGAAQETRIQDLTKKLETSGSLKDAAALVKARRAAR